MSQATLRIQKISGHAGTVPGEDTQREYTVCKLIDTTTCIGCKACEVACMEWNDLPFGETIFDNTYQTMPETRWNYWNLILFNEHEKRRRHADVADAQESVHALRGARLSGRVSCRRRDRPVHQRHRRFSAGQLHRLRLLHHRLPVQYSEVQSEDQARFQVHVVHRSRQRRPRARVHQIVPDGLPALRQQGRHERSRGTPREAASRAFQFSERRASTIRRASAAPASSTSCMTPRSRNSTAACRKIRAFR